jgi:hypothetical protein
MDFCARCGLQTQPGQPSCPRCGMPLRVQPPAFPPQYRPPGPPGRGGPPRDGQPRWMAAAAIVLVAVAAGAVAALILVRSPAGHTSTSPASTAATSPVQAATGEAVASQAGAGQGGAGQGGAGQSTTGPVSEQTAAQSLSRLLTQSISDRSAILSAYHDVDTCGSGLVADAQTFQQAATSRQNLLSRLGALPGASALPSGLLQALEGAWQASVAADQDYAAWARDESSRGCRVHDTADAHYRATSAPNHEATADKTTFVSLWNPIAVRYGLPTYRQDEL